MEYLPGNALRESSWITHESGISQRRRSSSTSPKPWLPRTRRVSCITISSPTTSAGGTRWHPFYPVVLDFGVASSWTQLRKLTMTGRCSARPSTCRPNSFAASRTGPPSDIYAFGVLAYELYAGQPPFHRPDRGAELAPAHTNKPAPPLPGQQRGLSDLMLRCLDKDPNKRPRAEAIAASLRAIAAGLPPGDSLANEPDIDPFAATSAGANAALAETIRATVGSSAKPVDATLPTRPSTPGDKLDDAAFGADCVLADQRSGLGSLLLRAVAAGLEAPRARARLLCAAPRRAGRTARTGRLPASTCRPRHPVPPGGSAGSAQQAGPRTRPRHLRPSSGSRVASAAVSA